MTSLPPLAPVNVAATPLAQANALLGLLRGECLALEQERVAYQALDATRLIARLTDRAAFVEKAARQSQALEAALVGVERDRPLADALFAIRTASKRLFRLEQENKALIERTHKVVAGVLDAVAPAARTYDLKGQQRSRPIAAYARVSRRV